MKLSVRILAGGLVAFLAAPTPQAKAQANNPCIGQLMLFGGNYCPRQWIDADGTLLPIGQYTALYSLYGTMYGGDGQISFAVPDLRGRAPVSQGQGPGLPDYPQGAKIGAPTVTLTEQQLPSHSHSLNATNDQPVTTKVTDGSLAAANIYSGSLPRFPLNDTSIGKTGLNAPVAIQSPAQVIRWCVAIEGSYCSRQ